MGTNIKGKIIIIKDNKFPCHYSYSTIGSKIVYISNNLSSVIFSNELDNELKSQLTSISLNENIEILSSNSFHDCQLLQTINIGNGLKIIKNKCFYNCKSLLNIELNENLQLIEKRSFSNCSKINNIKFIGYEYEVNDFSKDYSLNELGENVFEGCSNLKTLIIPKSIDSCSKLNNNFLKDSYIENIYLLGFNSSDIQNIKDSNSFGIGKNCNFYTIDNKKYNYINSTNTITEDTTFSWCNNLKAANAGKMKLRTPYLFNEQAVKWCIDYNTRTTETKKEKFPNVNCPIIVIYLDFKTSLISQNFLNQILSSNDFLKNLKSKINSYVFVLSREAEVFSNVNPDLLYFRNQLNIEKDYSHPFISYNFYYNDNFSSFSSDSLDQNYILNKIEEHSKNAKFEDFDYEPFEVKLEDPYIEDIPTFGQDVKTDGYIPWWYNDGKITDIEEWSI